MSFSDKIRILIEEREITQKSLASALQIPASTLGGYVQGTSEPDFETLRMFARYFNVSADYLLDMPDNRTQVDSEDELLRIFRGLSPEHRALFIEIGKAFVRVNVREAGPPGSVSDGYKRR